MNGCLKKTLSCPDAKAHRMNSFFVWLMVKYWQGPTWWPIVPNVLLTPLATFWMHRRWTFGS